MSIRKRYHAEEDDSATFCALHVSPRGTFTQTHAHTHTHTLSLSPAFPCAVSTAELIGVIAGGCVVVALIVGAIVLAVRRARKPSAVQYMPVHTEVDDDWSVN